ncbi:activity-dependent neuroprotective protein 2a [Hoplias malabaricus]|uniref:activity-dependent neuroprotective protein 2a n=1 Tax=Hoplias malabaricus TaxID=27720 RepID=UPI0034628D46
MYQVPVKDVAKLRRSRKRVKSILCDIALADCQDLVEKYKPFDAGDGCFNNTEWVDFIDGSVGKKRKKWRYRTEALCCNLCWFSTRSFYTFRSHVQRCHEEEMDLACLSACPKCTFISRPDVTEQHIRFFHSMPPKIVSPPSATSSQIIASNPSLSVNRPLKTIPITATVGASVTASDTDEDRYTCLNCGYHDSLLYVMKKHVLVNHNATLLNRYFGHKIENAKKALGSTKKAFITAPKYYCKECKLPAETIEHLLYHILSSEKHIDLLWHIMPFIREKVPNQKFADQQKFQNLAPKAVQAPFMVARPNFLQQAQAKSNGTMLLAGAANTAALLCPSSRPLFLSPSSSGLVPGTSMSTLQGTQHQQSTVVNSLNMVVPSMSKSTANRVPVNMTIPNLSQAQAAQQMLLPPGVQVNVPGKIGARPPMMVTPRLQVNQPSPRSSVMASQSVRLVPTGNKVNGVPTYTLAPVQVPPVQQRTGQQVKNTPLVLSENGLPAGSPSEAVSPNTSAKAATSSQKQAMRKLIKPNELAVLAPFLKIQSNHTVKCLRCNVLLTEQWIFQHLLHGLKCLFCPLMFYSFKQIMEHTNRDHSLKMKKNRDFIKEQFKLNCDDEGNLVFSTFNLNTDVPKDLLDNRELNLILITSTQEKIYIKMYPHSAKAVYPPTQKSTPTDCPFCKVKLRSSEDYEGHLKAVHHIVPTIHAILKSPAFKCIYCFGVYSEKSTPKTISIHVQRCRCAPKNVKELERQLNPDPNVYLNGSLQNSIQQKGISQLQKGDSGKPKTGSSTEKNVKGSNMSLASVKLELDPTGFDKRSFDERKEFLTNYFHLKPYPSRIETQVLAKRLWLNKADVLFHFSARRTRCMKAIQKKKTAVLLGFNMIEVNNLKHDLLIPEVAPVFKSEDKS